MSGHPAERCPRLRNMGTLWAAPGGHRVWPRLGKSQKTSPKLIAPRACMLHLHLQCSAASVSAPDPGRTPDSDGAVPGCGAHTGMRYPHRALPRRRQHPATPWPRRQPGQLLFRRGFVFTITLLRDYSACGFLARPICFDSAAGGSLPSPKLHAGLYKRPRRLGCGEARTQPGSAAAQGRFR